MNKKAISPLIATILLVLFALVLGVITMNWGKSYVESVEEETPVSTVESLSGALIIDVKTLDTPLKDLQIKHITGQLTEEEYLARETELLENK